MKGLLVAGVPNPDPNAGLVFVEEGGLALPNATGEGLGVAPLLFPKPENPPNPGMVAAGVEVVGKAVEEALGVLKPVKLGFPKPLLNVVVG